MAWFAASLASAWRDTLEKELDERAGFGWLAVSFATGCLIYFGLPREPLLLPFALSAGVAATAAVVLARRGLSYRAAAIAAVLLAGVTVAKIRVELLEGPAFERPVSAALSGRVVSAETRNGRRPRIVLHRLRSAAIAPDSMPDQIRITVAQSGELPPLGSRIALKARLSPLPSAVTPGGYDPRRAAFFQGIGGSGFALGGWTLVEPARGLDLALAITRLRAATAQRIMTAEPGETGAVAAALLVGDRTALSDATNESMRLSGLAHILSISGLHMMLVAGAAFYLVRALLALSPGLALRWDIRKWAAASALVVVTGYFTISGGGAATLRSYVMAAIMFAAILLDRPAISMRNLAISAFVVLTLEPESVAEPGFQMSFAAVAALIAAWQAWQERPRPRLADDDALPGLRPLRWLAAAILGVAGTSLVAGLATAPYSAYHFERVATYSLLGNLLAAPVVSAVIMPFGLLSLVAMPFGLDALPLWVTCRGIDVLLRISAWVAGLPGAEFTGPAMPASSLVLVTAGLLWLCLWRRRWRLLGAAPIALGIALVPILSDRADILIAPEGQPVAVRDASGILRVAGGRAGSYAVEQLFDKESGPAPDQQGLRRGVGCDAIGCRLAAPGGVMVAYVRDPAGFPEDCRRSDVVVTPLDAPVDCSSRLVIDAAKLKRFGAHAIRIERSDATPRFAVTTQRSAFPRPWQPRNLSNQRTGGGIVAKSAGPSDD